MTPSDDAVRPYAKAHERLRVAVGEFWQDFDKGDFALPPLAKLAAQAIFSAMQDIPDHVIDAVEDAAHQTSALCPVCNEPDKRTEFSWCGGVDPAHCVYHAHQTRERDAPSDSERLDWLEKNGWAIKWSKGYRGTPDAWFYESLTGPEHTKAESLREAIDVTLKAAQQLALSAPREPLGDSTEAAVQVPAVAATRKDER